MENIIENIVDKHLNGAIRNEINMRSGDVAPEMLQLTPGMFPDSKYWLPVNSKVTDDEIIELEKQIGYKLPQDYIDFLKYKHFYELQIGEARFCEHPVYSWRESLTKMFFKRYPPKYIMDKGYIPFADWSDWGCLCFDTNEPSPNNNYEVVLWDHEMPEDFSRLIRYSKVKMDFKALLVYVDKQDDEMKKDMDW